MLAAWQWNEVAKTGRGVDTSALARMREPLVFDIEPARRDFGYAPRRFDPTREMLVP